jgi:N-acetyl-anhydromuramyl-L-alanine amidase AmpD
MENVPLQIVIHHTAAVAPVPQFDAINDWHKARGFTLSSLGYYVGYHYVIEKDGTVRKAREDNEIGCHAIGANHNSIGICLVGDFDSDLPTDAQIVALGALIETKQHEHCLPIDAVYPHRHVSTTGCYGKRLPDDWGRQVLAWFELAKAANVEQQTLSLLHDKVYSPVVLHSNDTLND